VDPDDPLLVGTALIVMVVLPDVAPAAIVVGLAAHVAPVSICGSVHVIVIVEGKGAFAGVLVKSILTVAGVPAVTVIVPEVEASWARLILTTSND
jgi:hypothetical protein